MKYFLISSLCIFLSVKLQAQFPYLSPGTGGGLDQAFSIIQTSDGGYLVSGRTGSIGINASDFYFVKLDQSGVFVWSKSYGGQSIDEARAIRELPDGSFFVAGVTVDFGSTEGTANLQQMILMKLSSTGDTLWTRRFGGPGANTGDALELTQDGGCLVVGRYGVAGVNNDFFLVRTKANGDTLWTWKYGGSGPDIARSVKTTVEGGFIIAGTTKSFGVSPTTGNVWLMKTDAVGDTSWTKTFGDAEEEECYSVVETADNGFILTGRTGNNSSNSADIYVVKTSPDGSVEHIKTYGSSSGNDMGRSIIQTSDGGFALTGFKTTTQGDFDPPLLYVLQLDNACEFVKDTLIGNFNSPNGAKGYSIIESAEGGLVVCGENDIGTGAADIRAWVLKFQSTITEITGAKNLGVGIFPNPADNEIFIAVPEGKSGTLQITSITGQLVFSVSTVKESLIPVQTEHFAQGIYFVRFQDGSETWVSRFIKK